MQMSSSPVWEGGATRFGDLLHQMLQTRFRGGSPFTRINICILWLYLKVQLGLNGWHRFIEINGMALWKARGGVTRGISGDKKKFISKSSLNASLHFTNNETSSHLCKSMTSWDSSHMYRFFMLLMSIPSFPVWMLLITFNISLMSVASSFSKCSKFSTRWTSLRGSHLKIVDRDDKEWWWIKGLKCQSLLGSKRAEGAWKMD